MGPETEEPPPSAPAAPLAIERLVEQVVELRRELAERDAVFARELRSVLDVLARIEANYKLLLHEHESLRRGHLDHEERIIALESRAFRGSQKTAASVRRKRAAAARKG